MLAGLLDEFRSLSRYRSLKNGLPTQGSSLNVGGLAGSSGSVLVAALAEDAPQMVILVIAESPGEADKVVADLDVLFSGRCRLFPQVEVMGEEEPHYEVAGERVETVEALVRGDVQIVVTTTRATAEKTMIPQSVRDKLLRVEKGTTVRLSEIVSRLDLMGYERTASVRDVAQFAVRGGIIDVYGFGMAAPTRLEWWDDEIASVRYFDIDSQRSAGETGQVTVLPVKVGSTGSRSTEKGVESAQRESLFDLLPADTLVIEKTGGRDRVERLWHDAERHIELARGRAEDVNVRDDLFLHPDKWLEARDEFARIELTEQELDVDFSLSSPVTVNRDMKALKRVIKDCSTLILCDNEGQLERLEELLSDSRYTGAGLPPNVTLALGALSGGFVMPDLLVLTDHEIFRRARRIRRRRRYSQALTSAADSLKAGDFVVHLEHGIGIYRGLDTITVGDGSAIEVSVIEYEGGDRVNVPIYRIDQLERFRAVSDGGEVVPRLDRLGSRRWARQKRKTQAAINKMAAELLDLYARRSASKGHALPPDVSWQAELESSFLYEDTPDQRLATEEIKRDMERPVPMDRLVVGDVGYGKTEIAIRAAFKAVTGGMQAAVLVPTTILAEQHGTTFGDRMADFPVRVEVLSRFKSQAKQREIIAGIRSGVVDIVIGTHRLLSADVEFKDLGLLIVDEEHRFGVRHKEKLKQMRLEVDVLTLTATPIPRTLHFALAGLRDLTLIDTPPRDRSPVLTFVELWDDAVLEEVIARELDRGGQVFFVHNRIETIATIAARVERIAPHAKIAVAHGRMRAIELDRVMREFVAGDIDVLVSTMIVESGLDVPNANTMIVDRADQFGVAQLHQLRGRVGRGHRKAYCYLLIGDNPDPEAEDRLRVLEHHTELGSGYRLAVRDMELRGAGNLLGSEQSGHAHKVGVDLFMRWMNDAVKALKGEERGEELPAPEVYFDGPANLPDDYVPDEDAKFDFYRRLARVLEVSEIAQLRDEVKDRFGPLPDVTERLFVVSELRILGTKLGVESIGVRGDAARITFRQGATPSMVKLTAALDDVQFGVEVRRTTPLSLRLTRLGAVSLGKGLVRALSAVAGKTEAIRA